MALRLQKNDRCFSVEESLVHCGVILKPLCKMGDLSDQPAEFRVEFLPSSRRARCNTEGSSREKHRETLYCTAYRSQDGN